jgi:N-acetylglucosaminyldiphosphoundecaprenol N-acetyl-beta-D-mannosaminyltransferase
MIKEETQIFDIPISRMNMEQTVAYLTAAVEQGAPHQVITANPIMLMAALENESYKRMMQQAELIVPDGAGLVWAIRRLAEPVRERVAGIDLMRRLLTVAQERRWRVYFLGASAEVLEAAVQQIRQQFPQLLISGYRDGYFGNEQDEQVVNDIRETAPQMLFVGRSAAQQEPWIGRFKTQLSVPVMMGVGGSFDIWSGRLKRAPRIWQMLRIEWLYRLLQEPWRYKRMADLPKFVWHVLQTERTVKK